MDSNFKAWYDDADIPEKVNGRWVDLETGIAYDPSYSYRRPAQRTASSSSPAAVDRSAAKSFGGKALKGTAKQKSWAEKIRAEKLREMASDDERRAACSPDGLLATAKFWIENRSRSGSEIGDLAYRMKILLVQYREAQAARDGKWVAELAERYNTLSTQLLGK